MSRYQAMFRQLAAKQERAFVPFTVLGDPDPATSLGFCRTMLQSGADALELGIPFSDPVADGPVLQAASLRALKAGMRTQTAWEMIATLRKEWPDAPFGLLIYANLIEAKGLDAFYAQAALAGVDSILIADAPTLEIAPYAKCAAAYGISQVMIAPPNATTAHLHQIAKISQGYTYVVTRSGVTGADQQAQTEHQDLLRQLRQYGAPPCLLGFGISRPEHVSAAVAAGADGVISGSAVVALEQENPEQLAPFISQMKGATKIQPLGL